jgi:hypothetical protein
VRTLRHLSLSLLICGMATVASGQATRTWVSGVGDDVNPCSRTAPCKTWAGAISKTASKGEISALDPGGFGAVTITKSITLNGDGTLASILNSGVNGVNVNDSATATPNTIEVTLRNLSIQGGGTGLDGVRFTSGKRLTVEYCTIANMSTAGTSDGISLTTNTTNAILEVFNTNINLTGGAGILVSPAGGSVLVTIDNVHQGRSTTTSGLFLGGNIKAIVSNSTFANNSGGGITVTGTADVTLDHVRATGNGTGLFNFSGTPVTRLKDCVFTGNTTNGANNISGTMTAFQSNIITNPAGVITSTPPTH